MARSECLNHVFYEQGIPPEIALSLEEIYQSPFSVLQHFQTFRAVSDLRALVILLDASTPLHIMAYSVSGSEVKLLNELAAIPAQYLQYFTAAILDRYPKVTAVRFNRLKTDVSWLTGRPARRWKDSHDIAIDLPESIEAYQAGLGKQTRKHLKYYLNRLERDLGAVNYRLSATDAIDTDSISRVIEMNRARMKKKHIVSGYDGRYEANIQLFCRNYGLVGTLAVQGKVAAGVICYQVGSHIYLEAIAHDPAFDKYNLGQVCLYFTIKSMIERGCSNFHMLWGEGEYKYRFLGSRHELHSFSVYRSYTAKVLDLPSKINSIFVNSCDQIEYLFRKYLLGFKRRS